jgi:transcription factor 1
VQGPGALTRALLELPKERVRKIILMEEHEPYLDYLRVRPTSYLTQPVQCLNTLQPLAALDPRVQLVEKRGYDWDTYTTIDELGYLEDVSREPWSSGGSFNLYFLESCLTRHSITVHPHLHFISHIPHTIPGEQLVSQFLRCIPDKSWLFRFGRTPLSLILGEWMWSVSPLSNLGTYIL